MEKINWIEEVKKVIGNGELQEKIIKSLEETSTQIESGMELLAMKLIRDIMEHTIKKVEMLEKDIQLCRNKITEHEILINKYDYDKMIKRIEETTKQKEEIEKKLEKNTKNLLEMPIENLLLPTRALNSLHEAEIETIGQLISYSEIDLMEFEKFGKTSLKNIKERLATFGLSLKKY